MLRGRSFVVLVAVTVAVAIGAALTLEREDPLPERGSTLFPDLLARVNDVARVEVTTAGVGFRFERNGKDWTAPERDGFPLDADKVHKLLVGMAGLERVEPTTSNPELFVQLGLGDPKARDSGSVGFTLRDGAGSALAELVVGQRRPARGDPTRTEYFVRVPGEKSSWLVLGVLPHDSEGIVDWLDRRILALGEQRIASVRVTHPDGEIVTAVKDAVADADFRYLELPDGAKLRDAYRINDIGRLLADLDLEDVAVAGADDGGEVTEVVTETWDGLRVRLRLRAGADAPRATLTAEFDPALARAPQDGAAKSLHPEDEVRAEAARLSARWRGWVYVLPRYKADFVRRRQVDLIEAPKPDAAPKPAAPGG